MSVLDHWCHFSQDDLYSLAIWGTHPIIKVFTFKKEGREILFAHLEESPEAPAVSLFSSHSPRLVSGDWLWRQGGLAWE